MVIRLRNNNNRIHNKRLKLMGLLVLIVLEVFMLAGCKKNGPMVVLTTGFKEDVVFNIEDLSCTKSEVLVYLVNTENMYDEVFGDKVWQVPFEDKTIEAQYKETILARLAQIKAMNIFARENGITLDSNEEKLVEQAALEYFSSLTEEEVNYLSVTEDTIENMYREYAIACKLYESITDSVNPEISDDEARTVTVRSILIKTYYIDGNGNKVAYDDARKQDALVRAYSILERIKAGEEFEILAADYNEDEKSLYSFSRGVMPIEIEDAAFNMSEGEVSDIIETEYGYHIIKCITNFDEEQTDLHKLDIVDSRKQQEFTNKYDEYISSLTSNLNKELWDSIVYERGENITTTQFFSTYDKFFK